jgi:hypothetical protein
MSVLVPGAAYRKMILGDTMVSKATGTLAATTVPLFTITGGLVMITSIVGLVTTSITVANSYKLQINPTNGDTADLVAATDIGTTDTTAGTVLSFDGAPASSIVKSGATLSRRLILPIGQIEHVSAGTDGAITWTITWVPYSVDSALVVAA